MPDSESTIFAVPEGILADFYIRPQFCADAAILRNTLSEVRRCGNFYPRAWAEQTEAVRQIIPCAIVRNDARRLLRLRRAKNGRDDLRLRHTLLFGGHINKVDANSGDLLKNCVERELHEELGLSAKVFPDPIGVVADPSTLSSSRHFGVVFECRFAGDDLSINRECDGGEFVNADRAAIHSLAEIGDLEGDELDPWSSLLLTSDSARQILGRDFIVQKSLAWA